MTWPRFNPGKNSRLPFLRASPFKRGRLQSARDDLGDHLRIGVFARSPAAKSRGGALRAVMTCNTRENRLIFGKWDAIHKACIISGQIYD
jgi:hypothetical protein